MPIQRQIVKTSKPKSRRATAFILTGRTTLSEHLPGETIIVFHTIVTRSPYLQALVKQHASSTTIELRDTDPEGFKLYIQWLNTKIITFPFHSESSTTSGLPLRDCTDLIYAHIVGSHFSEVGFQDYIIDEIARRLDPAQTPDVKVLEIIFVDKGVSSVLKRFAIDKMFAVERKMVGLLRGCVGDVMELGAWGGDCEYHVHEEGSCYKSVKEQQSVGDVTANGTQWDADKDSDLMAMANHYLDRAEGRRGINMLLPQSSPGTLKLSQNHDTTRVSLQKIHYFGSAAWSREVHGLKVESSALLPPAVHDKPLPPLPSPPADLPPHSPTQIPPLSPRITTPKLSYEKPTEDCRALEGTSSTQDLIAECLQRLARSTPHIPMHSKVTEYLSTFPPSMSTASPTAQRSTTPPPYSDPSSPQHSPSPRPSYFPPRPPTPYHRSYTTTTTTTQVLAPQPVSTPVAILCPRTLSPLLPHLIKRKPVPPRGLDWIEQWERLDKLRKGEKKGPVERESGRRR
ncbi:Nn.00g079390.m01.CDS01 [Neocucurbitaria sp. VM-36]